jgi:predicted HicB family RNase H-like nuclease
MNKTETIFVRVTPQQAERYKAAAERRGTNLVDWIRYQLEQAADREAKGATSDAE